MGIAFAGLVALSIVQAKLRVFAPLSFYYMFLSFIGLYITLSVQSNKFYAWQEQLGAGFLDLATLAFFLSLLSILQSSEQIAMYKTALKVVPHDSEHLPEDLDFSVCPWCNRKFSGAVSHVRIALVPIGTVPRLRSRSALFKMLSTLSLVRQRNIGDDTTFWL